MDAAETAESKLGVDMHAHYHVMHVDVGHDRPPIGPYKKAIKNNW